MGSRTGCAAFVLVVLLGTGFLPLSAQSPGDGKSSPGQKAGAVLVELFTSEGCSSCPPADALLRQIDGKYTESGLLIVGVSEHVTYWNHLGWSDPYSAPAYTERQDAYGQKFHLDSVYTPQMVINGEEQILGSNSSALLSALRNSKRDTQMSLRIASVQVDGKSLSVEFSVDGALPPHGAEVYAIVADNSASSDVRAGENAGHTLVHASVARTIAEIGKFHAPVQRTIHIPLSSAVTKSPGQARHLILFAQAVGYGPVLGVDTKSF